MVGGCLILSVFCVLLPGSVFPPFMLSHDVHLSVLPLIVLTRVPQSSRMNSPSLPLSVAVTSRGHGNTVCVWLLPHLGCLVCPIYIVSSSSSGPGLKVSFRFCFSV